MSTRTKALLGLAAAAASAFALSPVAAQAATAAPAISNVACGANPFAAGLTVFLHDNGNETCYNNNPGTIRPNLVNVDYVWSGNNLLRIGYIPPNNGGLGKVLVSPRNAGYQFNPHPVSIEYLEICGQNDIADCDPF